MFKKTILTLIFVLAACAGTAITRPIIVRAQALPATKTLSWAQADAVTASVTGYTMTFDGVSSNLPPCTPDPTQCDVPVTFTTVGAHSFTVVAKNVWGNSPAATLSVTVSIPGKSQNLIIK